MWNFNPTGKEVQAIGQLQGRRTEAAEGKKVKKERRRRAVCF